MNEGLLLLELFGTFFLIGVFTFGGGYAIMSLIQSQIVDLKGWITEGTFTDIAAISQTTPGPIGLNCSTYVGYEVMKTAGASDFMAILGSVSSSMAIVLPSFLIMLVIVRFYARFHENALFQGVLGGLRPVVVGMIAAAAFALSFTFDPLSSPAFGILTENFPDWKSLLIAIAAFAASYFWKQGPIRVILGGAVLGLLLY
jgi:chromate transporter